MSILIKGMKMPKSCLLCPFGDEFGKCCVNAELEDANELTHSCPLVELPDHGDLIDRDKLFKKAEEWEEEASAEFERYKLGETNWEQMEKAKWRIAHLERIGFKYDIADAPVVIPAERSEDERTCD